MTTTPKQIEFLARSIVNRLEDRGLIEFSDAEAGIDVVVKALGENFTALDAITHQARQRLTKEHPERRPTDGELEAEIRRIAAERSFIL